MRRGRQSTGCWLIAVAALVATAGAATWLLRPEPGLLDNASRLADAGSWMKGFGSYFWMSDRSVLTFRPRANGPLAVRVDTGTQVETPLPGLSDATQSGGADFHENRLSPNGRYLLWQGYPGNGQWTISDMTGRKVRTWQRHFDATSPIWLPDGSGWLESHSYRSEAPTSQVITSRMASTLHRLAGPDLKTSEYPGTYRWAIGIAPGNQVVSLRLAGTTTSSRGMIEWHTYSIATQPKLVDHQSIPMPENAVRLSEAELSPQGDRFACFVQYTYLSPLERLLQRLLPNRIHEHQRVGLWVIRRDGRGAVLAGSEEDSEPYGLLWTLDGKRVSFVNHNTLYSVPAAR